MAIKTNAIKEYNTAVVNQSGRIGTVRCYTKNRLTYVRAASNSSVTNNRTNSQMTQRLLFSSLVALFSTLASHLRGAFQNKAKNMSDYNAFMQANQGEGIYMTKQDRMLGYSVALPVVVATGKLEEVVTTISGDKAVTSLALGSLAPASAKVADLSAAIVANNEGWNKRPLFSKERIMKKADSKMYETSLDCFLQGFCLLSPDVDGVCSVDAEDACLLHVNV